MAEIQIKYEKLNNKPNLISEYLNSEGWKTKPHIRNGTLIQFTKQIDYSQQKGPLYQIKVLYQAKPPQEQKKDDFSSFKSGEFLSKEAESFKQIRNQFQFFKQIQYGKKERQKLFNETNYQPTKFNQISVYIKAKNSKQIKIKDETEQFQDSKQKKNYNSTKWIRMDLIFLNSNQDLEILAIKEQQNVHVYQIGFISDFQKQLQRKSQKDIYFYKNINNNELLSKIMSLIKQLKLNQRFFSQVHQYAKKYEHKYYLEWLQDVKNQCK